MQNKRVSQVHSFPSLMARKKGQFYLIATIIIIVIVSGLLSLTNYSTSQINFDFSRIKDELQIESGIVLDYCVNQDYIGEGLRDCIETFTSNYADYSQMDQLYFFYGDSSEVQFSGYNKLSEAKTIKIETDSSGEITRSFTGSLTELLPAPEWGFADLTLDDGSKFSFPFDSGQSFYFVLIKNIEGDVYVITNED